MSANDSHFSVFWSRGSSLTNPPTGSALRVGKHAGEDPITIRADEIIGYLVIEGGEWLLGDRPYLAGLGSDSVWGVGDSPPNNYSFGGFSTASTAIVAQSGMDGGNGGWAVLYGQNPVTPSNLNLAIDEDQLKDSERSHTTEQVSYAIFE